MIISTIKAAIEKFGGESSFAKSLGIRQSTLTGFLRGQDINASLLTAIMKKAKLEIVGTEPNKLMERDYVILDGSRYHPGEFVDGNREVMKCFGSTHTTKQGVVLKDSDTGKLELVID